MRLLSALFRGKFLAALQQLRHAGDLEYHGSAAAFAEDRAFKSLLKDLYKTGWVAYAKAPMGGPEQVLKYLGRYTHRIAISNRRILSISNDKVSFTYKDRRNNDREKVLTLDTEEFIRRFLLHVLPARFHKIRHFGLLALRNRKTKLATAQLELAPPPPQDHPTAGSGMVACEQLTAKHSCPVCGANTRVMLEALPSNVFRANMICPTARAPPISPSPASNC